MNDQGVLLKHDMPVLAVCCYTCPTPIFFVHVELARVPGLPISHLLLLHPANPPPGCLAQEVYVCIEYFRCQLMSVCGGVATRTLDCGDNGRSCRIDVCSIQSLAILRS